MPMSSTNTPIPGSYVRRATQTSRATGEVTQMQRTIEETMEGIETYARREPWAFAAWVFGVGFVLGWKLKPW